MDLITKLRYQGYLNTPLLWKGDNISPFKQVDLSTNCTSIDDSVLFKNKRLGKLVEEFVFYHLKQQNVVAWIADNLQIQDGKRTIGEIDALYYYNDEPIHLEIIYKFYLYDTLKTHDNPLAYWIGPNRKDTLLYKLKKLDDKQFPLLHRPQSNKYLERYNLDLNTISQQLCFKGQLFLPYFSRDIGVAPLNKACISGFYISFIEIEALKNMEFYIPEKLDWLIEPHNEVDWQSFHSTIQQIELDIYNKYSPLVWLKYSENEIKKCFITFW